MPSLRLFHLFAALCTGLLSGCAVVEVMNALRARRVARGEILMEVLVILVPLALGLLGFLWSLKNGQYEDLEGAAWRAIADDEQVAERPPDRFA